MPSRTIPITGGSCSAQPRPRALSSTRRRTTGAPSSGSAPPPTRATVSSTCAADEAGEPLGARAHGRCVLVQHAQHRHLAQRPFRLEVEEERSFERGEAELVDAERAVQRMAAQSLDEVGAADDDPGLRAAEQLVAAEADEVGAGGERAARGRLVADVDERAGAEVVEQRQAVRACDGGELLQRRALGEADDAEVRLVHAQEQRGVGVAARS